MPDPCPICRKDRVLVGYRHNCTSAPVNTSKAVNTGVNTTRKADRHSAGYMAAYMKRRRAAHREARHA